MNRLLLTTLAGWLLLLLSTGAGLAQHNDARQSSATQASAKLECCADQPICAGETASLTVALEGKAPFTFRYSDGNSTYTVNTSSSAYELKVSPGTTRSYTLVSMQDALGTGQTCGAATVAVNQCQPNTSSKKDCSENCFDSKVLEQKTEGSCTTYTLQVNNDGSCQSALSHYSISIPCGRVTEASNSRGWPMEIGTTDPTTGISGIKVDNIKGFGENGKAGSFTVTYTVCASTCGGSDPYCGFLVAYKAGTCVNYGVAAPPYVPMSGSLAAIDVPCFGQNKGSIQLSLAGGKAPYTYSWSNGSTTANLSSIAAGNYSLTITDAANKQLVLNTRVEQPLALALNATTTQPLCGTNNGGIDLAVTGGSAPYSYTWTGGATSQDLNSLAAGSYTVTVTDAKGCTATGSYNLQGSSSMQLSLSGGNGGCAVSAITATINGGTAPYSYSWNTGASSASITPATAGTYTLTVTDAAGCSATATTTTSLSSEPISLSYEYSSPSCSNATDGWIDLNVSGGSGTYSFSWSNGSTTEDLESLAAGPQTVTVTDSNGCTATARVSVPYAQPISIVATEVIQPDCLGNLGGLTVTAYNGSGTYTYSWSHGATGEELEGLESGYYTVTATDEMGCSSSRSFQIKEPSSPQVAINGGSCGQSLLTATVSGGEGPYQYEWSTGDTGSSITASDNQYYTVVITDQNGCTAEASKQVGQVGTALSLSTTTSSPSCWGNKDGSIDLSIEGGSGSYTIVWSNGATSEDLTNVGAGNYTVVVTDESGCVKTTSVTVSNPAAISLQATEVITVTCNGLGGITVEAQNGSAPYTYSWTHGATGNSLEALQAGLYTLTVTDAKGCTSQKSFTIREELAPTISISNTGSCNSQQLTAQVTGNTGPYTYQWSSGQTTANITPNVSGSYSLIVTDANGCTATALTEITLGGNTLSLYADVEAVSCSGNGDGSATITVAGGTAPYTFDWSNGLNTAAASNLTAGVYSVKVTDALGCYDVVAFEIKQSASMNITKVAGNASSCGQPNGSIAIAVQGGTAPYTYKWNTGATSPALVGVSSGNYTVAVIDAIGCAVEASFEVTETTTGATVSAMMDDCADTMIAAGSTANLNINLEGQAPYTFTYSDGSKDYTVTTSLETYVLNVKPAKTTTYTLKSIAGSCGTGSAAGSTTVTVVSPKIPVCTDGCFSTNLLSASNAGNCTTYTLQVNAGSDCRYDLSHFEVAVPCGSVSSMNNSRGWPMSVGLDPTTGVWGVKVDNINGFSANESFTLSYTLCNEASCSESQASCGPLVAYKAGQCVYFDKATPASNPAAEAPDWGDGMVGPGMSLKIYPNPQYAGQQLQVEIENLFVSTTAQLSISTLTGLQVYQQSQAVSPGSNVMQLNIPANLASGSYIVVVMFNNERYTKQLFIY